MDARDIEQRVEAVMNSGLTCTESMLRVFNDELDLGLDDNALKMATGFSGGVGGKQHICGALTGAVMVIGAMKGRTSPDQSKDEAMALTSEVFDRFREVFGTVLCSEILKDQGISCPGQVVPTCAKVLVETLQQRR